MVARMFHNDVVNKADMSVIGDRTLCIWMTSAAYIYGT
jgi:hypothetical protein